ncbi:MAG TPA: 3-hydroxyacyl-CoA dehydrogenase NAD-binding domain-containing protein [Paracoccaceae bacterium]|nr:3-hydroxyacyl-CoA dehydrogenase NAD-binding domain-containing protein [Paracoccaceae bacterium]
MTEVVRYETEDDVAVITVDNPPVNALSQAVRAGIKAGIERAQDDVSVKAIALVCAGRTFIAGADITEFGKPPLDPSLRDVNIVQETARKPIVAGIHGTALGGGLETALACHYRAAIPSARVGLPEVKLGILPGAGGTQRLPRLVGVEKAVQMICSGDMVPAGEALSLGIVDRIVEGDLRDATVRTARELAAGGAAPVPVSERNEKVRGVSPDVFENARAEWTRKKRGFMAPQHCIAAIQAAAELPFAEGMKRERELFEELLHSDQSKAQRHFFFAERQANKVPDVPKDTPVRPIDTAAVLGAGTMGGGIAMNFANAGIPVTVIEQAQEALDRGLATSRRNYEGSAKRGRFPMEEVERRMGLIRPSLDIEDVADADIVIEAVFENMAVKKEVFGKLDRLVKPGAILATNTSTLDVNEIAASTSRPQDVIGLHFFSPANVMRLLEEVRGERTAKDVIATCMALAKRIGKVPVLVGVCHGFVGNRMLHAYFDQAFALLHEGAVPEQVDRALYDFGMAMGPFAMSDLAGLDVSWRIRQEQGQTNAIADRLCEMGRFGQKTGAGYFRYEEGSRTPIPDPEVAQIIEEEGRKQRNQRRSIGADEIVDRTMLALVNEGAKILEEGIALRASDIDVVYVYGYGFPVYRGGPMFWAESQGLAQVLDQIRGFHAAGYGDVWEPAALIEKLAAEGKGFSDHDKSR